MSEVYTLAGGCFWCLDASFSQVHGVIGVDCGYTGGTVPNPTYQQVCTNTTGHAEAVRIEFDPEQLPPDVLLDMFFTVHDPTTPNRQGDDVGTQYRSAMFYTDDAQRERFTAARDRAARIWDVPIVTEIAPLTEFFRAEEYHQDYFAKNPEQSYCRLVVSKKVAAVRSAFADYVG